MLEKNIEYYLRRKIQELGGECLKFVSPGYGGVPDRIILLPGGHVLFVELKRPGEVETKRQLYVQGVLRSLGFTVFSTVDSIEKANRVIRRCEMLVGDRDDEQCPGQVSIDDI